MVNNFAARKAVEKKQGGKVKKHYEARLARIVIRLPIGNKFDRELPN